MDVQNDLLNVINQDVFLLENLEQYQKIFDLLPFAIYWKNKDGKYYGRNRYAAEECIFYQLESSLNINSVIMKDDHDFFDKQSADCFRENDLKTLNHPSTIQHYVETLLLPSGDSVEQISVKRCVLNKNLQPVGILGCTVNINKLEKPNDSLEQTIRDSTVSQLHKLIMRFMSSNNNNLHHELAGKLLFLLPLYPSNTEFRKLVLLTSRELQCLCLLLKGYSARCMASVLSVSYRTIEIYLGRIKEKLNLPSKSDTTSWFWNLLAGL